MTAIDQTKAAADIRITSVEGSRYFISTDLALSGRGISAFGGGYLVTEGALAKLQATHSVVADF